MTVDLCSICKGDFLYWNESDKTAICDNDEKEKITNNSDGTTTELIECESIGDCQTTVCFEGPTETTPGCRMCDKNYSGANWDTINNAGSGNCVKEQKIVNCEFNIQTSTTANQCYGCADDFAVSYNDMMCVAYTVERACRKLATDNKGCWYCWHSYYWDMDKCKLKGFIVSVLWAVIGLWVLVL